VVGSGWKACGSLEGVWKSKYGKQTQATLVRRAWKSAEDDGSQIGSVRLVGRVLEEARTPQKRRLGLEEAKHPAEDKPWMRKAAEVQWKCRQPTGSNRKTVGGNQSVRKSVGRIRSEVLGLRMLEDE